MFDPEVSVFIISNLIPDASQICLWVKCQNSLQFLVFCSESVSSTDHDSANTYLITFLSTKFTIHSSVCFIFGPFASLGRAPLLSGQVSILIDPEGAEIDCQHLPSHLT